MGMSVMKNLLLYMIQRGDRGRIYSYNNRGCLSKCYAGITEVINSDCSLSEEVADKEIQKIQEKRMEYGSDCPIF